MFRNATVALLCLVSLSSAQGTRQESLAGAEDVLSPAGIATDSAGDIYIADAAHHRVQRVSNGVATTIAGNGVMGFGGDGGPATDAMLNSPSAIAVDSDGTLFIADAGNYRVRRVLNGIITTVAGSGVVGLGGDGGPATKAALSSPTAVAVNSARTLFIAAGGRVRRVAEGIITTIAGNGTLEFSGDNGAAIEAGMDPRALAVDAEGSLYIADEAGKRVRRVYKGIVTTVALGHPTGLTVDARGNLYFADASDKRIRRFSNGEVIVVAGDSEPITATALAVAPDGSLLLVDGVQPGARLLPAAATPVITSVVTAYASSTLSQNAWVEIRGSNLVPSNTPSNGQDWSKAAEFASCRMPTALSGISVTVNGVAAYIYFYCSSATNVQCAQDQINILTPLDNTQGTVQVVVNNNGAHSAPYNSTLRSSAPSFFQWAGRYAVATHLNNTGVGPASLYSGYTTPARTGEVIVLWMTGFGLPSTPLTQGSSTQRGNLPLMPVIQFNGIAAAVSFAGVVSPGLYQVNVTVPSNLPAGDVPVGVSYNGVGGPTSSYITIAANTALPSISSFTATPSTINSGQSSTLTWAVSNATTLSIDNGIGTVTGTTRTVSPGATTTYKLTATNSAGSVTATTTVTVSTIPAPTINSFTASSTSISAGQSTTLSWNVSNASSISIDNGIGSVAASGSRTVSPGASTTYTLTAASAGGTRTATVTVSVQAASCPITGAAANDTYFISNSSVLSKGSWWVQGFTVKASTPFQLRVASDYTAQTAVFGSDQLNAFENNGSFQAYSLFDNKIGFQSFTLSPGSYYVGIRNTSTTSNQYDLELDYAMSIPGLSHVDTYLSGATTVGANGGKLWQPFTVQCGVRYLMDGGNSGLKTYIIPADQLASFQANQGFKYFTDYSSDYDDPSEPGFYEVKLPPGDYYLIFWNDTNISKAVTYNMERWR